LAPELQAVITLAAEVAIALRRRNTADSQVGAREARTTAPLPAAPVEVPSVAPSKQPAR
jgi:hypothetical protein